jgi:hypothetical protein
MAYATIQDVKDELPQLPINGTVSRPSEPQVLDSIILIEAHVNAVLKSRGYTTPISGGPESLKILRKIVRHGVAAEVIRQAQGAIRDQGGTGRDEHQRIYDSMLRDIFLPDATSGATSEPFYIGSTPDTGSLIAFTRGMEF